jgi:hypothetical protein
MARRTSQRSSGPKEVAGAPPAPAPGPGRGVGRFPAAYGISERRCSGRRRCVTLCRSYRQAWLQDPCGVAAVPTRGAGRHRDEGRVVHDVVLHLRGIPHLDHVTGELPPAVGVDGEAHPLPLPHAADVCLRDPGVNLEPAEIARDEEERRVEARGHRLSHIHVAGDHDAVGGRVATCADPTGRSRQQASTDAVASMAVPASSRQAPLVRSLTRRREHLLRCHRSRWRACRGCRPTDEGPAAAHGRDSSRPARAKLRLQRRCSYGFHGWSAPQSASMAPRAPKLNIASV